MQRYAKICKDMQRYEARYAKICKDMQRYDARYAKICKHILKRFKIGSTLGVQSSTTHPCTSFRLTYGRNILLLVVGGRALVGKVHTHILKAFDPSAPPSRRI